MSQLTGVLKHINKYLQQAKAIEKLDPTIAYYTRLYAVMVGLKAKQSKADEAVLNELMNWCESHKPRITKEDAKLKIENFALQIFQQADDADRANNANKSTAQQFYLSYIFMDTCRQFGPLSSDIDQKFKYAMWRAAELNKAIKEGRQPMPPEREDNLNDLNALHVGNAPSYLSEPSQSTSSNQSQLTISQHPYPSFPQPNPYLTPSSAPEPASPPNKKSEIAALKPSPFTDYGTHFPITRPHANSASKQSQNMSTTQKRNSENSLTVNPQKTESFSKNTSKMFPFMFLHLFCLLPFISSLNVHPSQDTPLIPAEQKIWFEGQPRPPGTLLLNMLIKNEEEHLNRTLPQWAKIIDYWIVGVDDANTDSSEEVIKKHLSHIPGSIVKVHFNGMGPTWDILVKEGLKLYPRATHGIIADADFAPMKSTLDKMELDLRCSKHMFTIWTQDHRNERKMDWIYRNIEGATVKRRTHQIVEVPELPHQEVFQTLIDLPIEEREGGYQDRTGKKAQKYIEFLEADLKDYPNDTRTLYYLGYAHFDIFNAHKANPSTHDYQALNKGVDYFKQRAVIEAGNKEERWFAMLKIAEIYERFLGDWNQAELWYKNCTILDPERADAWFYIGQHYRLVGQYKVGLPYLKKAALLPIPQRSLFQWHYLYNCLAKLEYARCLNGLEGVERIDKTGYREAVKLLKTSDCTQGESGNAAETKSFLELFQTKNSKRSQSRKTLIKKLLKLIDASWDAIEIILDQINGYVSDDDEEDENPLSLELQNHITQMEIYTATSATNNTQTPCRHYRLATTEYLRFMQKYQNEFEQNFKPSNSWNKLYKLNLQIKDTCR